MIFATTVLLAERDLLQRQRDAARQSLRDLLDATSWYGPRVGGHIRVSEGAMDVAMGLVVAWFGDEGTVPR